MTGDTGCGCILEICIFMAGLTSHGGMFAIEVECKFRVVYRVCPSVRCVAGGAVCAILAGMFVFSGMA